MRPHGARAAARAELLEARRLLAGATVSGRVFGDVDGNGLFNSGDQPLAGWTIYADSNNNHMPDPGEPSAQADANGLYTLSNVPIGQQVIRTIVQGTAWIPSTSGGDARTLQLFAGQTLNGVNFVMKAAPPTIAGTLFNDANGDGVRQPDETPLAGWTIFLDRNRNGLYDSFEDLVTTNASGSYTITTLPPGTYTLGVKPAAGWQVTSPATGLQNFTATQGQQLTGVDFGVEQIAATASVGGMVYRDNNADGVFDSGDTAFAFWNVYLDANNNDVLDPGEIVTRTDAAGHYSIGVLAGQDQVVRTAVQGVYYPTTPSGASYTLNLAADQTADGTDFGLAPGQIVSGNIWNDLNGNGFHDSNEPGLPGWGVQIYDSTVQYRGTLLTTATTDATGAYAVGGLPIRQGVLTIIPLVPPGWAYQGPITSITISQPGQVNSNNNYLEVQIGDVNGFVFDDLNLDGAPQPPTEPGLAGWTVFDDVNGNGRPDAGEPAAVSEASGYYELSGLTPGSLTIREIPQPGYVPAAPAGAAHFVTFAAGAKLRQIDFGNADFGTLSGVAFNDANNSATRDAGEAGLAGVTVFLDTNQNGRLDSGELSVVSDANGNYRFPNVPVGQYAVVQIPPAGYRRTTPLPGSAPVRVAAGQRVAGPLLGDVLISTVTMGFNYLLTLAQHYGQAGTFATGDVNDDGRVDFSDLLVLAQNYGHPLSAASETAGLASVSALVDPLSVLKRPRHLPSLLANN